MKLIQRLLTHIPLLKKNPAVEDTAAENNAGSIDAATKADEAHPLSPAAIRKRQLLVLLVVTLMGLTLLWLLLGGSEQVESEREQNNQIHFTAPVQTPEVMTQVLSAIQLTLKESESQTKTFNTQLASLNMAQDNLDSKLANTQDDITKLWQDFNTQQSEWQERQQALANEDQTSGASPALLNPSNTLPPETQSAPIQTINIALSQTETKPELATIADTIPPGTFVQAVMLNGLDADTSVSGQGNPKPVVMRVTGWGNLPNGFYSQLKDCVVVGAGIGDISSERAYIRLDTLSCVLNEGDILETKVFGHVVDKGDGKVGVKGTLRLGEGHLVRNAFLAGLVSGIGRSVSQQSMTSLYTPIGQTTMLDPAKSLQYGLGLGVGESGDRMSDYFIRRADQYSPVIEVSPQAVDIIFIKEAIALTPAFNAIEKSGEVVARQNNNEQLQAEIAQVNQLFNPISPERTTP